MLHQRFSTPPRAAIHNEAMMAMSPWRAASALAGYQKPIIDRSSPTSVVSFNFDERDADRFEALPSLRETRYFPARIPAVPSPGRRFFPLSGLSNQNGRSIRNLSSTNTTEVSTNTTAFRTPRSSGSDSSPRTPQNAVSRITDSNSPDPEPASATPTPQNLVDNPERLAKVKTEMCVYYEKGKRCPW